LTTPGEQKAGYRFTVHFSTSFYTTSGRRLPDRGPGYTAIRGTRRANNVR
jgi:hypothetical protein